MRVGGIHEFVFVPWDIDLETTPGLESAFLRLIVYVGRRKAK